MYHGEKLNNISHLVGAALALIGFGSETRSCGHLPNDCRYLHVISTRFTRDRHGFTPLVTI